jgi:hypothetical protein
MDQLTESLDELATKPPDTCAPHCDFKNEGLKKQLHTIMFIDWDDTLFPSSHLKIQGTIYTPENLDDVHKLNIHNLETEIISLLNGFLSNNDIDLYILTNSDVGWVELCLNNFMKRLYEYLKTKNITVKYAKTRYSHLLPKSMDWKKFMIDTIIHNNKTHKRHKAHKYNLISLGDSLDERNAIQSVYKALSARNKDRQYLCKSIKLTEVPTLDELHKQLSLVTTCHKYIIEHDEILDLQLTVAKHTDQPNNIQESNLINKKPNNVVLAN